MCEYCTYFSADAYHDHRLLSGIPEGTDDITVGGSLPLEFNLDYMNGGNSLVPYPRDLTEVRG